ncbi:MAG: hypothetical protein HQL49_12105 [Gammaproteobacteria bacterium]|nr:hypothetical protein [Gammaproteobacteria bacterium]
MNKKLLLSGLLAASFILLNACGSSDDSDDSSAATSSTPASSDATTPAASTPTAPESTAAKMATISGTVAVGAPLVGTVQGVNAAGKTSDYATINSDGSYTLTVAEGAPYMLKATSSDMMEILYSYAEQAGVANITPLTNLAIYEAYDRGNLDTLFAQWSADSNRPDSDEVSEAATNVAMNFQNEFSGEKIAAGYNFFTTQFAADGSGIDAVLDAIDITIDMSNGSVMVKGQNGEMNYHYGQNPVAGETVVNVGANDAAVEAMESAAGNSTCLADLTMSITSPIVMSIPYKVCYTNISADACGEDDLRSQVEQTMAGQGQQGGTLTVNSFTTVSACPAGSIEVDMATQQVSM